MWLSPRRKNECTKDAQAQLNQMFDPDKFVAAIMSHTHSNIYRVTENKGELQN